MCIGIFSFRAFDRRLARLAAPISSGVRQGGGGSPSGARLAQYPSGARVRISRYSTKRILCYLGAFEESLSTLLLIARSLRRILIHKHVLLTFDLTLTSARDLYEKNKRS